MKNSAICERAVIAATPVPDYGRLLGVVTDVAEFLGLEWVTFRSTGGTKGSVDHAMELLVRLSCAKSETYFSATGGRDYGEQFALLQCAGRSRRRTWIES